MLKVGITEKKKKEKTVKPLSTGTVLTFLFSNCRRRCVVKFHVPVNAASFAVSLA